MKPRVRAACLTWVWVLGMMRPAYGDAPIVPSLPPARLDAEGLDRSLDPPPLPDRVGPRVVMGTGLALVLTGLVGTAVSPGCATPRAGGGCVDRRGTHDLFPVSIALGIALGIAGNWAYRQDAPAP